MRQEELVGKAQTVLGLIDPECLGVTLPHEHLFVDQASVYLRSQRRPARRVWLINQYAWITSTG
jgi:predicted metal-dependent phosphotriesterase family hydrolase